MIDTTNTRNYLTGAVQLNSPLGAAIARGMRVRGDKVSDVATLFGMNVGRVSELTKPDSPLYPEAPAAALSRLPPPGPYAVIPRVELAWLDDKTHTQLLVCLADVMRLTQLSRRSIERLMRRREFPAPVATGTTRRLWKMEDIREWVDNLHYVIV